MKLALVRTASNILTFGGYNIQEIGLAKSLLKYGVSTDVYARFSNINNDTTVVEGKDCRVMVRPLKGKRIYREIMYYPTLKQDLIHGEYDIVQMLDDSQMMLPYIFFELKKSGIKTILWQGMYRNFSGKAARAMQIVYDIMFARLLNKSTDLKIAKTEAAKDYLLSKNYENIAVVPVGLDKVSSAKNEVLEDEMIGFKAKYPHVLLYIGAIEARRNVDFILDLFIALKRKDLGLIIIGDGPLQPNIEARVKDEGLSDRCLIYKKIPNQELVSVYENADLFLLPTRYEIYGMVVMEALTFGLPVISTPEAGPQTILKDEVLGKCIDIDSQKWIDAINFYLENFNTVKHHQYRKDYVEKNHRWNKIGEVYYGIISKLIK